MGGDDFKTFSSNGQPERHDMNEEIKNFSLKFMEWLGQHERDVHDGARCVEERANLIAFLMHKIGFGVREWDALLPILEFYEEQHHREE